ncbi:MAG: 2,3-bisphosphoglycerate-dependent phosphoglycerate mutase [Chlamydiae bacterium]|nr:2,3-bisphosphoglycerate-dependent phosphoglycerate mutase [Chlamydiota bacterium]
MLKTLITFMRHGHAIDGKADKIRPLSTKGRLQVKQCALHLKTQPLFDLIITSSAVRAKETAQIIVDEIETLAPVIERDELYQPPNLDDQELVNELLERLGAVPLKVYNNHDAQGAWDRYSSSAYNAVCAEIERHSSKKTLIVAHGNIINAIGLRFSKNVEDLTEIYFNYCGGFEIYEDKFILLP